jgi:hypothetical protein
MVELSFYGNDDVFPEILREEIRFYVSLNQLGRRLLITNHGLASTVWCFILEKCGRICRPYSAMVNYVYFFLREQPHLVQPRPSRSLLILDS